MEVKKNYCKILGLNPFKEDSYTEEFIRKHIAACEEKWTKELQTSSTLKSQKFALTEKLELLPEIRSTMDSPVLREDEFRNAREILERKASKVKRHAIILHDGTPYVPIASADEFAKKLMWEGIDGRTLINAAGLSTVTPSKPASILTLTAFGHLRDVDCYSPVELINDILSYPEVNLNISSMEEDCGHDDLRLTYEAVLKKLNSLKSGKIPNIDSYIQAVRSVKVGLNPDEKYNELFLYGKCYKQLEPAFEQMEEDSGDRFSRAYIDNILTTYVNGTDLDSHLCLLLLEDYCIRRQFPANFSESETGLGTCPHCKSLINMGPKSQFCPSCGASINSQCPKCGTAQTSSNIHCIKCSAHLKDSVSKANSMGDEVRKNLLSGKTEEALAGLADLETEFPEYEGIPVLKSKVRETSDKIRLFVDQMESSFQGMNYYSVKDLIDTKRGEYPSLLRREDVRARYDEACAKIRAADELCVKAAGAGKDEGMELYISASQVCPDYPSAVAMLKQYPPESPGEGKIQVIGDTIEMTFEVPEDRRGMTFCIYRGEGSYPEVDQSTKPLVETEKWYYTDNTAEPGVEYYYKVYSKRWGILSEDCTALGPELVFCEVTNVKIDPTDDGLVIKYDKPRGADRVHVWRKEGGLKATEGDEVEILHSNTGTILDPGLKAGTVYNYLFASEYDVNGVPQRSSGTSYSGMTTALPNPVTDLDIRWDRKRSCYVARWSGNDDAVLYYSTTGKVDSGVLLSTKDLSTSMTRIEPLDDEKPFRFSLPESTIIYVYPAIIVGNTAVMGKEYIVANLRPFSNLTKIVENHNCRLNMVWPEDAEYAVVEIRGTNADGSVRSEDLEVSRAEYEINKSIEFGLGGSLNTEVTVYAGYNVDETEKRSVGISTHIYSGETGKVFYTIEKDSVKGDRRKIRYNVSLNCADETRLPRCVMVASEEGIPLRQNDGEIVWESDDPIILTEGRASCSFVLEKGRTEPARMRLFFPDKSDYNRFRFVHPLYNRRK